MSAPREFITIELRVQGVSKPTAEALSIIARDGKATLAQLLQALGVTDKAAVVPSDFRYSIEYGSHAEATFNAQIRQEF